MSAETSRSPDTLPLPSTVVFDAMTQPISVFDDDGRYRYINRAGLELLGMTAEAVLGRRYLELFPELAAHPFKGFHEGGCSGVELRASRISIRADGGVVEPSHPSG